MTTIDAKVACFDGEHGALVERARLFGFSLASRVTDTGQTVWEWRRGDEPRPQFVTPRVAAYWMSEWIENHEEGELMPTKSANVNNKKQY